MKIKYWFLNKVILLCDYALLNSDAADNQNDINDVVAIRNYLIKQRDKIK